MEREDSLPVTICLQSATREELVRHILLQRALVRRLFGQIVDLETRLKEAAAGIAEHAHSQPLHIKEGGALRTPTATRRDAPFAAEPLLASSGVGPMRGGSSPPPPPPPPQRRATQVFPSSNRRDEYALSAAPLFDLVESPEKENVRCFDSPLPSLWNGLPRTYGSAVQQQQHLHTPVQSVDILRRLANGFPSERLRTDISPKDCTDAYTRDLSPAAVAQGIRDIDRLLAESAAGASASARTQQPTGNQHQKDLRIPMRGITIEGNPSTRSSRTLRLGTIEVESTALRGEDQTARSAIPVEARAELMYLRKKLLTLYPEAAAFLKGDSKENAPSVQPSSTSVSPRNIAAELNSMTAPSRSSSGGRCRSPSSVRFVGSSETEMPLSFNINREFPTTSRADLAERTRGDQPMRSVDASISCNNSRTSTPTAQSVRRFSGTPTGVQRSGFHTPPPPLILQAAVARATSGRQ